MTTTASAPANGAPSAAKLDVAALEILCSLYLARTYGQDQPAAWCEDAPGTAAARAVGITPRQTGFDRESAFSAGFDLALRVSAVIANNPFGPIGIAIDDEIARTRRFLDIGAAPFSSTTTCDFNVGDATDLRATKKATSEARQLLTKQLPKLAAYLQRQADVVSATHADLDGDLTEAGDVLEALINPRGVAGEDAVQNLAVAIGLIRGTTYIAKNGDISFYETDGAK